MKILYLGSNLPDTDLRVSKLALSNKTVNHGLVTTSDFVPESDGYYHTTIVDVWAGGIIKLAKQFDKTILLDQPRKEWTHWKELLSTYKMLVELEKTGIPVEYKNNKNIQSLKFMSKLLKDNKTFCVYPFIHLVEEYGDVRLCSKSDKVKKLKDIQDWRTDPDFVKIRQSITQGKKISNCNLCYKEEELGFTSTRVFESMDWAAKMNITSMADLDVSVPTYYEVRPSNKCNLQCRMCVPENSHLIDREFKKIGYKFDNKIRPKVWGDYEHIQIEKLAPQSRIYSTGGEPTIQPKFYNFLEKCIALGRTDLDIQLTTNGQKISARLIKLLKQFDEVNFSFSIDGYGKVFEYIRWGSDWEKTVKNAHTLFDNEFYVSVECVPSLWNITNLYQFYEFFDIEFPNSTVFLQQCYWTADQDMMSVFNHPCPELVIESMERIKKTNSYYTDARDNKSIIDTIYKHYTNNPKLNLPALKRFFDFSDMLDKSRGIKLVDYVPELEEGRKVLK